MMSSKPMTPIMKPHSTVAAVIGRGLDNRAGYGRAASRQRRGTAECGELHHDADWEGRQSQSEG